MRTVLITGANGNLGTAVVEKIDAEGYHICAVVGPGDWPEALHRSVHNAQQVNLTNEQEVQLYINSLLNKSPGLNAAVLLVGGFTAGNINETDGAVIDKQIALNFKTAYFVARPLLDHFEKTGGGQFILIGARPALQPEAGRNLVAYALSKSLVFGLADMINASGREKKISATVIVPSTIDTEANRKAMPDADFSKWVKAEMIAETIAFILSDSGASIRDTVIKVYGES